MQRLSGFMACLAVAVVSRAGFGSVLRLVRTQRKVNFCLVFLGFPSLGFSACITTSIIHFMRSWGRSNNLYFLLVVLLLFGTGCNNAALLFAYCLAAFVCLCGNVVGIGLHCCIHCLISPCCCCIHCRLVLVVRGACFFTLLVRGACFFTLLVHGACFFTLLIGLLSAVVLLIVVTISLPLSSATSTAAATLVSTISVAAMSVAVATGTGTAPRASCAMASAVATITVGAAVHPAPAAKVVHPLMPGRSDRR